MEIPYPARPMLPGPWVTMRMTDSNIDFAARIDTGADLTMIPETYLENIEPNGKVNVRMASGELMLIPTYAVDVTIASKAIHLPQVSTTKSVTGLIGMDALEHFDIMLTGGVLIIESV